MISLLVILVVLHLLNVRVNTDAHAQITAHIAVAEIDNSPAAFAVLELRDLDCFKIGIHFDIESDSLQLLDLDLNRSKVFGGGIELVRVELRTLGRHIGAVCGRTC